MMVISIFFEGKNNSCRECEHCDMDTHPYFYGCQRLQHEEYDPISGKIKWVGKLLSCRRERGVDLDWWDKIMIMFSWNRCGKDGQYWIGKKEEKTQIPEIGYYPTYESLINHYAGWYSTGSKND